jgi:hypothetical protein
MRQCDDIAVLWVDHGFELLDIQMQEAHHKASDRQAVRDNKKLFSSGAIDLVVEGYQVSRGSPEVSAHSSSLVVVVVVVVCT